MINDQATWQTLMKPINHHKNRFPFLEEHDPTSCGLIIMIHSPKPSQCSSRIVINLCLDPKMRSIVALRNIEVIFSVHGDSTWVTPPPGTSPVRFEQEFVEYIIPCCNGGGGDVVCFVSQFPLVCFLLVKFMGKIKINYYLLIIFNLKALSILFS